MRASRTTSTSTRAKTPRPNVLERLSPRCALTASHTRSRRVRRLDRRIEASIADIDPGDHPAAQHGQRGGIAQRVFTGQGQYLAWWMLTATSTRPTGVTICNGRRRTTRGRVRQQVPRRFAVRSQFAAQGRLAGFVTS